MATDTAYPISPSPRPGPRARTRPLNWVMLVAGVLLATVGIVLAALTATTRVLYGLEPLGPARTVVAGREFDLTDAEADRVADFITGLIAARGLD